MNIYLVCPVRSVEKDVAMYLERYVQILEDLGNTVHYPPRDAPQADPTGQRICMTHLEAIKKADQVHVYWDVTSFGSHFDIGMAYALGLPLVPIGRAQPDCAGKSYWKAVLLPENREKEIS